MIDHLASLGVRLTVQGERLRVSAPHNILSDELRGELAARKAEIIAILDRSSAAQKLAPPIERRSADAPAPLSFAQERLWFLAQLEPRSSAYNLCRAVKLTGRLDASALARGMNEILRRHEVLRTAIRMVDGRPAQMVEPAREIEWTSADLSATPAQRRAAALESRIAAEINLPFDLAAGRLLRPTLLRLSANEHALLLVTHHSAADAWSMGILMGELWQLYCAFARGEPSPLADLPLQYADYARWQRDLLRGELLEAELGYWKQRLADLAPLDLPSDRRRPARQSFRGGRVPIQLPAALTAAVNELSHRLALTPFMTLLAAWQVLLHRYSGQTDIAVGSAVANRQRPELEGLIGLFVNTLVLRGDLAGDPSFIELLGRVKKTWLGADAHRELPFEKLVQELQPERDLSRNPLFQVMFVLQNATRPFTGGAGLTIEPIELSSVNSPFDLSVALREHNRRYTGYLDYSTDLFDGARIERMAGHFETLLGAIVADPDQPISQLPLITEPERRQILFDWNNTGADYPQDQCIHQLFEQQVEKTPDAVALQWTGRSISYRELNQRANQLAHHLIALGVGPEVLVAIAIERSIDLVVGLLAILKAGGAYLPLDTSYPAERLRFMIEDSKVALLLTEKKFLLVQDWRGTVGLKSVYIDGDWPEIARLPGDNPNAAVRPNNLAYVIYTSGSTGQPKGVLAEHRATINRLAWMWRAYPFGAGEKNCLKTSLSFVDSVWEIFGPLLHGVPSVIADADSARTPRALIQLLSRHRVSRIVLVPSLLRAILDDGADLAQVLPQPMLWTCSGEALPGELAGRFAAALPRHRLINLYGSSEVAGDVTCCEFTGGVKETIVPIGRPIANTRIYLLDRNRQPVPIGVPGEIHVGGANLARGYLNRPELSAERFIADPWSEIAGNRLFKTGDLARYRGDGASEFLQRVDRQVKIRGQRVEVEEIEARLNRHAKLRQCVVVADGVPASQLIAYVVAKKPPAPPARELRDYLRQWLPDYMIPAHFIALDRLPLSANGKIDLTQLAPPQAAPRQREHDNAPPRSPTEAALARAWQTALKLDRVGRDDNFFELGGHSLLAVQVLSALREQLDREIALRDFYQAPTLAALAAAIDASGQVEPAPAPPVIRQTDETSGPLTLSQEQLWRLERLLPGTSALNLLFVFELTGNLDVSALQAALREIVQRHDALRMVIREENGQPLQAVRAAGKFQLPVRDLRAGAPAKILQRAARFIARESARPFDLARGPLLRCQLLALADGAHLLLVNLHHIAADQWSMALFRRELAHFYNTFARGEPATLPAPALRFLDYARGQREALEAGSWDEQLAYWRDRLGGNPTKLNFRGARKRTAALSFQIGHEFFQFDEARLAAVKQLAQQTGTTPYMVLLTALNTLLYYYTGAHDLRVATLMANRGRRETEAVIGHFLNTTILRVAVDPDRSARQLLEQVRDAVVAAQANQELPFEHLLRSLEADAAIDRAALSQVLCNYHLLADDHAPPAGLEINFWQGSALGAAADLSCTTFDLVFQFRQSSNQLSLALSYKAQLFSAPAIARLGRNFEVILTNLTGQPDVKLSALLRHGSLEPPAGRPTAAQQRPARKGVR